MTYHKCHQEKPTPITYQGNQYCLKCATLIVDDAHEEELKIESLIAELGERRANLAGLDAERLAITNQQKELVEKLATIEKKIEEVKQLTAQKLEVEEALKASAAAMEEVEDNRNSVLSKIDKAEAELKNLQG